MTALLALLALLNPAPSAAETAADTLSGPGAFVPDQVLTPPGGARFYLYTTGTSDVVALRVSVPISEGPTEAGAGQILRALAEDRMNAVASRIGARARVARSPDALVYEVAGPAADMDFLAWVLREGLREPDAGRFSQLQRDARIDVERRLETPEGALALRLRDRLSPGTPPMFGTLTALERMDPGRVRALWERTHARDALTVVIVGNVSPEVILASLTDLGIPASARDAPPPSEAGTGQPIPTPELIRHWVGEARSVPGGRDPRALVATRMIAETIRSDPGDYEVGVELWELNRGWVLVLSGAAYPRARQAISTRVEGLIRETVARVTDDEVRRHVAGLRSELLEAARTPWGLADVVGHALDAGEAPDAIQELLAELRTMRGGDVVRFLESLVDVQPVREVMDP